MGSHENGIVISSGRWEQRHIPSSPAMLQPAPAPVEPLLTHVSPGFHRPLQTSEEELGAKLDQERRAVAELKKAAAEVG